MDLVYANEQREDLGFMPTCTLDLAYGVDENNFACTISREQHCCEKGYMLYMENTEYGGIVDTIKVSTASEDIVYSGRTWHGILDGKILCPDAGRDYLTVRGEANAVLGELINRMGLGNLFVADTADSQITITAYSFDRYVSGYKGIRKMLRNFSAKLHISFESGRVKLSAVPLIDYSVNDEFDSSVMDFNITKNYRPTNHLICLGKGDLADRKVIHLYTDAHGIIQPYTSTEIPLSNADYVLDTSKQILFYEEEVADVYDNSKAEVTENYVPLSRKPSDWERNITSYFGQDADGKFVGLSSETVEEYLLLKKQPYDWDVNFGKYFALNSGNYVSVAEVSEAVYALLSSKPADWSKGYKNYYAYKNGTYSEVEAIEDISYTLTKEKPKDWDKNYKKYFYYWSDGTTEEYRAVSGISISEYVLQTIEPSDWKENYQNYYYYSQKYKYEYRITKVDYETKKVLEYTEYHNEWYPDVNEKGFTRTCVSQVLIAEGYNKVEFKQTWKEGKFYTKKSGQIAPAWEPDTHYLKNVDRIAPTWASGTYYSKSVQTIPTWASGTYYEKNVYTDYPDFVVGRYYEKRVDDYADLVAGGIERLRKAWSKDLVDVDFSPTSTYDIGDIVGATESVTGISVRHEITKKIVKISQGIESITYEIGE